MKIIENPTYKFLDGGGEMGELIRSFDWSKTSLGSPDTWSQSLQIAVHIMLDCPFGMYIAWGNEYIQLYNDGYRPILGATKHPQALGSSSRNTFKEAWTTIGPMFDGVMQGKPVGFPDFILHLDRNGYLEECIFDFSYSPIRLEDGEVGGILVTVIETTEKEKALKAVKESEERFQNLVREANVGIVVLSGEEMRIKVVNEAYGKLIGLKPDELLGKPLFDVIPDAKNVFLPILNQVRQSGESLYLYEQPYSVITNGKKINGFLNLVYQAYKELDDTITGVTVLCQDVTATVNIRKINETSEKRFSNILSQFIVAIGILEGQDMVITFANEALLEMWGKGKNILGKPLLEVLPEIKDQGFPELLADVYTTGVTYEAYEAKAIMLHDRKPVEAYYNFIYQPYKDIDEKINGITILATEVTEQVLAKKQIEDSENQFRTFADSIQNLAWIANPDGWVYWFNQKWYDYTGTTLEEMQGWKWQKVHHPDHLQRVLCYAEEGFNKDEPLEITFPLRRHDGAYFWFLTRVYPVKDINGNIERWIGTSTDIHEQIIKEQQKDEFISIASHEMKTPLSTAKGYIELLLLTLSEDDQTALYATKANQAVERLHDLITELLDASKIQNGQLNYTISTFDFNKMVGETIENFQLSTKNHIIEKIGNFSPQITGDRNRLQQVLINLLSNAVKYSPRADRVIVKIEEQHGKIQVSVQDFGVGMSDKHLNKIFDRYYRVDEHAIQFQGLGIGLYISNSIIQRHHGTMWAESEPDKGSTFYFTIPF